jgi:flagellar hook-associated protein 2
MPVSSLGVGSGLELGSLVDNLVKVERQSAEGPLNRRQARAELRLSALGSLRSSVAGLLASVGALEDFSIGRTARSSADTMVTGTATSTADLGSYLINVVQVATAQSLSTDDANPFTDPDASLGAGTVTVTVGTDNLQVSLTPGQDSLRDVRDAINDSGLDAQAALVQSGGNYYLLLTSGTTGTGAQMMLTVDGTVDTRLASANMIETVAAQDASYTVNGLSLTSTSNTIADVVPGVTLELHADTGGASVALDVVADTKSLGERLDAIVTAFNTLSTNMSALGSASPDGSTAGPLVGDASLRSLQREVGRMFSTNFATEVAGNPFANLIDLGIHTDLSGIATLDQGELQTALDQNEAGVEALVAAFSESFNEKLKSFEGSSGILTHRADQLSAELKRIGDQRTELDRRMSEVEARLVAKFSALDSLVAQFNQTSTFLTQQLASISAITNYRRNNS